MTDMVIHRVEQLETWEKQPEALELIFGLGLEVGDLLPNPDNEIDDETRAPTVKVVAAHDTEQHMEDAANDHNPCNAEEAYYIDK